MEEFNLHRVNPQIQQFYYCFNIHSQVELDNLLTDLIHTCGYQNYLVVNENLTIKLTNFTDEKWNKGPKDTSTFAYYLQNEIFLNYHAVSQFSLKELKQTIVHEVIHAKLDVVDQLGDGDDNDPRFPDDLGHGKIWLQAARQIQRKFRRKIPRFKISAREPTHANAIRGMVLNHRYWSSRHYSLKHHKIIRSKDHNKETPCKICNHYDEHFRYLSMWMDHFNIGLSYPKNLQIKIKRLRINSLQN